jgi:hypothetical protein
MVQHLSDVPLNRRLLNLPELAEQTINMGHEPSRLLTADLLQGIAHAQTHDGVRIGDGRKQLR